MSILQFPQDQVFHSTGSMSFEDFYQEYYSNVLFYVMKKINSRSDAEDLTGEVFLYCYERFSEYDPTKSSYKTWLFLIVNSRLKNYYRDRKVTADFSELENVLMDDGDDMDRAVYLEQMRDQLVSAIRKLPEKQMKAVVWRYFQERSFEYIAEQLETTPGNVRVMLSRAMDRLESLCAGLQMNI